MAILKDKLPINVPGKFYVDQQCLICNLCCETAPDFFKHDDEGNYSYVYKQPSTDKETALCIEAMNGCPCEAIGDNGA